ncbi:MAG: hypothetical protein LBL58_10200 [Tannerellaceae bacterium]|nr:hypothetical protein [Tannerellaceae bacterium]
MASNEELETFYDLFSNNSKVDVIDYYDTVGFLKRKNAEMDPHSFLSFMAVYTVAAKEDSASRRRLIEMVRKMRQAQKKYFTTKSPAVLREAKELEEKVDKYLEFFSPTGNQQGKLF